MHRKLSDGSSFYFDAKSKTLYIVQAGEVCNSRDEAESLVQAGKAQLYSKQQLESVGAAMRHIVLLD